MRELSIFDTVEVSGGGKVAVIGTFVVSCVIGTITGGPVGLGYVVGTALATIGVMKLDQLAEHHKEAHSNSVTFSNVHYDSHDILSYTRNFG